FTRGASLFTIRPDGSHVSRLAAFDDPERGLSDPSWSPDGRSLVLASGDGIYRAHADGTVPTLLRTVPNGPGQATLSPDGAHILFDVGAPVDSGFTGEDLWTMRADGTHPRHLFRHCCNGEAIWSPDSRKVAFWTDEDEGGFYVVNADGKRLRRF